MHVPAGERLSLVLTSRMPPAIGQGELLELDDEICRVRLDVGSPTLAPDDAVVIDFVNTGHPLVRGHVEAADGVTVRVRVDWLQPRDQREFPRVESGLEVRYRVVPEHVLEDVLEGWVQSGAALPDGHPWRRPEPFMDLSATGLGFDDDAPPFVGDRLMITFTLPNQDTMFRAVAHVVRVFPAKAGLHRVAVELVRMSDEARHALMERTLQLLRLPGEADEADGEADA